MVLLTNAGDIGRLGLRDRDLMTLGTVAKDDVGRAMGSLRVVPYNVPAGCVGACYPEAAGPPPIWHCAEGSKALTGKAIPARVERQAP
jgi:hypothetical protein